jgi:hypothetical protein
MVNEKTKEAKKCIYFKIVCRKGRGGIQSIPFSETKNNQTYSQTNKQTNNKQTTTNVLLLRLFEGKEEWHSNQFLFQRQKKQKFLDQVVMTK